MNLRKANKRAFVCSFLSAVFCAAALVCGAADAAARQERGNQSDEKSSARVNSSLPLAEKIVDEYLRAIGGRKRAMGARDAVYEWSAELTNGTRTTAETRVKSPASWRTDIRLPNGAVISSAANGRTAWRRERDGALRTLTNEEANDARLRAIIAASRLVDYKKSGVAARTIEASEEAGEPVYVVEFSTLEGGRWRCAFGAKSKLLLRSEGARGSETLRFKDYRAENNLLEPHRVEISHANADGARSEIVLTLRAVHYNAKLSDAVFDPPRGEGEAIDVAQLLREVERHQREIDERLGDYTFKQIERAFVTNGNGKVYENRVEESEVYPVPGHKPVHKLISEDGKPLSPERAAKEAKRAGEELEKAQREAAREREKKAKEREKRAKKSGAAEDDEDEQDARLFLGVMARACEFIAPRRESLRGREAIVFDFRPRSGFKPKDKLESFIATLTGVVWIDPQDKQFMRFEARTLSSLKVTGGLAISFKPGATITLDQARVAEGLWMPSRLEFDGAAKLLLLLGADVKFTQDWSDYRRFNSEAKDVKLDAPQKPKP